MKIETKYSVNDEVYFMFENKIEKGVINGIQFITSNNLCPWSSQLLYCVQSNKKQENFLVEKYLFETKEDLLNTL